MVKRHICYFIIDNRQKVKKILLKNKRVFRPDHVTHMISTLSVSLRRFTGLRGFFTKLSSLMGYGPRDNYQMREEDRELIAEVIRSWPFLARLNFNDQPLDVPDSLETMISPVFGGLTKLSLSRCQVCIRFCPSATFLN
jgi:hypothetical protein